jgi:hypothetical protein
MILVVRLGQLTDNGGNISASFRPLVIVSDDC